MSGLPSHDATRPVTVKVKTSRGPIPRMEGAPETEGSPLILVIDADAPRVRGLVHAIKRTLDGVATTQIVTARDLRAALDLLEALAEPARPIAIPVEDLEAAERTREGPERTRLR